MRFYYGANNTPHDTIGTPSIGLATTKLNRLIGVRSINGQKSRLLTRPFKVNGDLVINARALGEIRIQVTDERDNAIVGYTVEDSTPFVGDQLKAKIKWGERCLSDLRGTIVRLRFMLEDAELYSFDFE